MMNKSLWIRNFTSDGTDDQVLSCYQPARKGFRGLGFGGYRDISPIMENRMEKKMEHEMETGNIWGIMGKVFRGKLLG